MDSETWHEHVNARFDRLEDKLDSYNQQTIQNTNDLTWMKGSIKLSLSLAIAIIGGIAVNLWSK